MRAFVPAIRREGLAMRALASATLALLLAGCSLMPSQDPPAPVERAGEDRHIVSADPALGRRLIKAVECGVCHQIPGIPGADGIVGPPLEGFAQRQFIAGIVPNRPVTLVQFIQNAPSIAPNTAMPDLPIRDEDARHIAAYLYTLR